LKHSIGLMLIDQLPARQFHSHLVRVQRPERHNLALIAFNEAIGVSSKTGVTDKQFPKFKRCHKRVRCIM